MRWAEVSLVTSPEAADAVTEALISAGSGGVASANSSARDLTLAAYFPVDERLPATLERVKSKVEAIRDLGLDAGDAEVTIKFVEDEDWATAWKSFFKPLVVGRIVVKPTWEDFQPESGQIILELDPGMAFGTGNHETTRMCLTAIQKYLRPGDVMLDVGCGSGILAIAGALLGASQAVGVEVDPVAVRAAKENVTVNHVDSIVRIIEADTPSAAGTKADLVVANIVADAIIGMAPQLADALKPGGLLITSGIIDEREDEVAGALTNCGLLMTETIHDGEWVSIVASLPPHSGEGWGGVIP